MPPFKAVASLSTTDPAATVLFTAKVPAPLAVNTFTPLTAPFNVPAPLLASVRLFPAPVTPAKLNVVSVKVVLAPSVTGPV